MQAKRRRPAIRLALIAIAGVLLTATAVVSASGPRVDVSSRRCGSIGGVYLSDIKATNTSCKKARSVARAYGNRFWSGQCGSQGCTVKGFKCSYPNPRVVCRKGTKVVRFSTNEGET